MLKRGMAFLIVLRLWFSCNKEESQKIKSKQENQKTSGELVRHNQNGKWGYTDATGKIAIEPRLILPTNFRQRSGAGKA
jgi:hypothetical protein